MESSSPTVERSEGLSKSEMADVAVVQNGELSNEGSVGVIMDSLETDGHNAVSSKIVDSAVNHVISGNKVDLGGSVSEKSHDLDKINEVEEADKENEVSVDKIEFDPVNGEESGMYETKNGKKLPEIILKGACGMKNGHDEISNDSKFEENTVTKDTLAKHEAVISRELEDTEVKNNSPKQNLMVLDNSGVDTLQKKESGEPLQEKESEESLQEEESEEPLQEKESEETLQEKESEETLQEEESEEPLQEEESEEPLQEEESEEPLQEKESEESLQEKESEEHLEEKESQEPLEEKESEEHLQEKESEEHLQEKESEEHLQEKESGEHLQEKESEEPLEEKESEEHLQEKESQEPLQEKDSQEPLEEKESEEHLQEKDSQEHLEEKESEEKLQVEESEEPLQEKERQEPLEEKDCAEKSQEKGSLNCEGSTSTEDSTCKIVTDADEVSVKEDLSGGDSDLNHQKDDDTPVAVSENVTPAAMETESNSEEQNVILIDEENNSQNEEEKQFDNSNCDLFVFTMKEGKESDKSDDSFLSVEEKDGEDNCCKKVLPQSVFEDITEDEDSDEEQFENIELEVDDLIDTPDTSINSNNNSKGDDEVDKFGSDSAVKTSDNQVEDVLAEREHNLSNTSTVNKPVVNSFMNVGGDAMEAKDAGSDDIEAKDEGADIEAKDSEIVNGPGDKIDSNTKSCENVDPSAVSSEQTNVRKERPVVKKKSTARKSGTPVSQTESAPLKRINMHPIKNVTMNISEVEDALKFDLDCAKRMKRSDSSPSVMATESGQGNTYKVISVTKSNSGMRKKRKKRGYDFPGCKKKKKSRLSDDVASPGASSVDSVSLSESDLMESDSISSCSSTIPLSQYNQVSDQQPDSTICTSAFSSSSTSSSISLLPSSSCLPTLSSSTSSKSPPGKPGTGKSSKIKSVLEMLHERNRQQAAIENDGPITTSTTTTTTTIMVSPPPNKPIIEGVKRKGTPRKRREDVICVSDDDDEDDLQWKAKEGKRSSLDSISSSGSSTTTVTTAKPPSNISPSGHAPVVMMVAQHSSNPSLRSLLPRNMIVTSPTQATTGIMRPGNAIAGAPPGSLLAPLPLVSTLPVGMKAVSVANLQGGVTAFPLTSLPPGSTIFTAVQANPGATPIPGATLLNITPPAKASKSMSKSMSKSSPSHSSSSPKSSKSSKSKHSLLSQLTSKKIPTSAAAQAVNSESLRALLVGKPYTLGHLTPTSSSLTPSSTTSSLINSTPVVFQMLTSKTNPNSLTTLVPLPSGHQPVGLAAMSQSLIRSASLSASSTTTTLSKSSNYSVIKPHYSMMPPNGVSCLTPPKTPDTDSSSEVAVAASLTRPVGVGGQCEDNDVIPLCCCKITVPSFNKLLSGVTYCQALDSVDNKVLGCCNKVTSSQLVRPGVKIPFMAVCETHRKRLRLHQCCPGCGHFCSQGKFQQCRKEGTNSTHHFHKQCMFYRAGKQFCPHCGEETSQCEVELKLSEDGSATSLSSRIASRGGKNKDDKKGSARIGVVSKKNKFANNEDSKSFNLPNKKSIQPSLLPTGPDQASLIRLCKCIGEDRPKKYRTLPKDLFTPSLEGDMDKVFYLLMDEMNPNIRHEDHEDQTALHAAAISGNLGTVFVLQQWGAEIHAQDRSLRTPLMCAAENGFAKVVQFLIKAGAKVEDRGEDGMTSLHYAAKAGYMDVIQVLLNTKKLDVNVQDDGGWTPIIWATESMLPDIVHYLISQGGDPNKKDNEENTGLHWSAFSGSVNIAEMFLDLGCELDTPNEHGDRALHIAARQDHYDIVVHLLARGANVDVRNHKDETPVEACVNKTGQVSMALKVNQQLRSFAAYKLIQPERLLERDITMGREKNPVACVNKEDNEPCPTDYLYIVHNVETTPLNINCVITGLQSCRCKDDCSSMYCVCARSSVCCWYDKTGRLVEDFNLLEPPLLFECNRACRCWVNCNNRVVQNGIVCRLQLFRTNGRGWGVRTLMDIPKGTFVCEYIGELISDSEADRREDDSYLFDLDNKDGDTYCIDARKYGNIARFINHLCEPNLVPVKVFVEHQDLRFPRICFFSSREIKAYEELGFDYGEKFWIIKWKHFTCACQSVKCKYSKDTIQKTLDYYKLRFPDEPTGQEPA